MKLENIMQNIKWKNTVTKDHILYWFHIYKVSGIGKSTETESRSVVGDRGEGWGMVGFGGGSSGEHDFFWGYQKYSKIVMMIVQLWIQ